MAAGLFFAVAAETIGANSMPAPSRPAKILAFMLSLPEKDMHQRGQCAGRDKRRMAYFIFFSRIVNFLPWSNVWIVWTREYGRTHQPGAFARHTLHADPPHAARRTFTRLRDRQTRQGLLARGPY